MEKIAFSIIASIFEILGFYPYLRDAIKKKTKPHVFTWLIWAITNAIAVAGLWIGGGGWGSIAATIAVVLVTSVFLLSLRFGKKDITKSDILILIAALSAIVIWVILDNPVLAVLLVSAIDAIGYFPTFRKSFKKPRSETLSSWGFFAFASIFAIFALEEYNLLTLSYLATISVLNTTLFTFLIIRRRKS